MGELNLNSVKTEVPNGRYRHYKGREYEVVGMASHSETMETLVVYRQLYGDYSLWVRPAVMWNEIVAEGGKKIKRFELISEID